MRSDRSRPLQVESLEERAMLNAKWTVLVYMDDQNSNIYGGDSLDSAAVYNVGQMESVGSTASVNIVAELGRPVDSGDWTDTRRALIIHNTNPNVMLSFTGSNYIDLGNNVNMTTTSTAEFHSMGRGHLSADHYMLDLWDHGGGLDGVCFNDSGNSLSFNNVTQALSGAGTHMDLVAFDACLLGMEEMPHRTHRIGRRDGCLGRERARQWLAVRFDHGVLDFQPRLRLRSWGSKLSRITRATISRGAFTTLIIVRLP